MINKARNDGSQSVEDGRGLTCMLEREEGGTKHADHVSMGWMVAYKSMQGGRDDLSTLALETESRVFYRLGKYSHGL